MKKWIVAGAMLALLAGCSGGGSSTEPTPAASGTPAQAGKTVEVAAEGTKFEPPVPVEQMPDGAWACVMKEKVHYASMEQGEGRCTICKMKLVQHH